MTSLLSDEDALVVARILSSVRHKRALREAAETATTSKGRRRQGKPNTGPPRDAAGGRDG
jgi:hypothetical protein